MRSNLGTMASAHVAAAANSTRLSPGALASLSASWSPSSGTNINSWQLIDEDPDAAVLADNISHNGSSGGVALYRLTATPSNFVSANTAAGKIRCRASAERTGYVSGTARLRVRLRNSGGTDMTDTLVLTQNANVSPSVFEVTLTLNAGGLAANTKADIDTWRIRFECDANSGTTTTVHAIGIYFDDYVT